MRRYHILLGAAAIVLVPSFAAAQDAAESAVIISGTGQATGRAQTSLGSSISRAMGNAANAIAQTRARTVTHNSYTPRHRDARAGYSLPIVRGVADPLERADVPTYTTGTGAAIRASGTFRQSETTTCTRNCGQDPKH